MIREEIPVFMVPLARKLLYRTVPLGRQPESKQEVGEMEKVKVKIVPGRDGSAYIYAGKKCLKWIPASDKKGYEWMNGRKATTNTRYLHASCDRGPVEGETSLIYKSGEGWRDYLVILPHK